MAELGCKYQWCFLIAAALLGSQTLVGQNFDFSGKTVEYIDKNHVVQHFAVDPGLAFPNQQRRQARERWFLEQNFEINQKEPVHSVALHRDGAASAIIMFALMQLCKQRNECIVYQEENGWYTLETPNGMDGVVANNDKVDFTGVSKGRFVAVGPNPAVVSRDMRQNDLKFRIFGCDTPRLFKKSIFYIKTIYPIY